MRGTIHLVTADDAFGLRPLVLPVLEKELARHSQYAPLLRDVDLAPVLDHARAFLAEPRSTKELRSELAERFPDLDPAALAYACRNHLALVQVPPRGLWTRSGQVTYATAEAWLAGRPPARAHPRRGGAPLPAGVRAGHRGRHRGLVAAHRTARGASSGCDPSCAPTATSPAASCSTWPTGPSPDEDSRCRSASCPSTTTCCSSHADRSRVIDRALLAGPLRGRRASGNGSVLVDGLVQATWRYDPRRRPQVVVTHQPKLSRRDRAAVEAEAHRALAYLAPGIADAEVALRPAENAGGPE